LAAAPLKSNTSHNCGSLNIISGKRSAENDLEYPGDFLGVGPVHVGLSDRPHVEEFAARRGEKAKMVSFTLQSQGPPCCSTQHRRNAIKRSFGTRSHVSHPPPLFQGWFVLIKILQERHLCIKKQKARAV